MDDFVLTCIDATLPCTLVVLCPEWTFEEQACSDSATQRSLRGRLSTVCWGTYAQYRVPVRALPGDEKRVLETWWAEGARLAFTLNTSHTHSTAVCRLTNARQPLADRTAPDADSWAGILELGALRRAPPVGKPFILDHPVVGRLDQPGIALVE